MGLNISDYSSRFASLHCNRRGEHYSPHKPVMLLATIDLFDRGELLENKIRLESLLEPFAKYFEVVQEQGDKKSPINPFFYLKNEKFWHHKPWPGKEPVYEGMSSPPSMSKLFEVIECAFLDDALYSLLCAAEHREVLRQTIIDTYFPNHREQLLKIINDVRDSGIYEKYLNSQVNGDDSAEPDVNENARTAAFSRVVREAYDFRCAACGLRLLIAESFALVDAAHLIPFRVSHDNDPRNGMALCKNHHWAMDRNLVAPGPDHKWHVSNDLDERIDGQNDLVLLKSRKIILPAKDRYFPRADALEWRMEQLRKTS